MDFLPADGGVKVSSAGKRRSPEDKFHIEYPATREFLTWVELGCLARALGFPPYLIRDQVNEEVEVQENGILVQQLHKMMDLKLLHQSLHRSFNMHTADWNLCVIKRALHFLHINMISFEELHSIRVAYDTYEASDMKGLNLDKRSLLRTLKMCQRIISPKKLMHRVKHMKPSLEENNRIQLYEFFDLIMWCDTPENAPLLKDVEQVDSKDDELYNMVDFETLLSHQDQRQSRVLDERYLAEEWDFGRERLGEKRMFKGEVVYIDQRVKQTQKHKKRYRLLKTTVGHSQRQVYRALAGSIRPRPISAPNLSAFSTARDTPATRASSVAAVYKSVQRRLHSAPSGISKVDVSDRPTIQEYHRVHTPSVVTSDDLDDVTLKMQNLEFDVYTLGSRCQVKKEDEMNFYIPDYQPSVKESSSDGTQQVTEKKREHWTPEIIDNLVYPSHHQFHHSHNCDARFRGWMPSAHRGSKKIFTVPTFDSSPHGKLLAKQRAVMLAPVADMRRNYVTRYTSKKEAKVQQSNTHRPCTAPSASPRTPRLVKRIGCRSAISPRKCSIPKSTTTTSDSVATRDNPEKLISEDDANAQDSQTRTHDDDANAEVSVAAGTSCNDSDLAGRQGEDETHRSAADRSGSAPRAAAAADTMSSGFSLQQDGGPSSRNNKPELSSSSSWLLTSSLSNNTGRKREEDDMTGPSIRHTRSKVVEVGGMGTIQLLESIQEHDAEDRLGDTSTFSASPVHGNATHLLPQCFPNSSYALKQRSEAPADSRLLRQDLQRKQAKEADTAPTSQGRTDNSVCVGSNNRSLKPNFPVFTASVNAKSSSVPQKAKAETPATEAGGGGGGAENPPLGLPRQHQQRVGSAASSTTISDSSDSRDPSLTPLTSVTVTIKNKDQRVSSSTRLNDIHNNNNTGGGYNASREGDQSPANSFKSSRPCVTSTPRKAGRCSPAAATPRRGGSRSGPAQTSASAKKPAAATQRRVLRNGSATSLPLSDGSSAGPSPAGSPDIKTSWGRDRILAMNATYEAPRGLALAREAGGQNGRAAAVVPDENSMEDVATWIESNSRQPQDAGEQRKKSIQFAADTKDVKDAKPPLPAQSPDEKLLRGHKFDLDAETPRRFTFNKATTRRLLGRVDDVISPELRTRIRTGNTGLKVI